MYRYGVKHHNEVYFYPYKALRGASFEKPLGPNKEYELIMNGILEVKLVYAVLVFVVVPFYDLFPTNLYL